MKIVIMAGGKGTRITSANSEVPKPMIKICGKPILQYQIECLQRQGYMEIILVIGHLGNVIEGYFGNGAQFNVQISYIREKEPLGTAGALYFLKDVMEDDFLLINGDIIFDVDIRRFYKAHKNHVGLATVLTHPNSHPYDSGIIGADEEDRVIFWLNKEDERGWYQNRVNAGLHILSARLLKNIKEPKKTDLDRELLKPLIAMGELYVYDSPEYVRDMGTPERYRAVAEDIASGLVERRNLVRKQKAVFLDRDGTINRYCGLLKNIDEFALIDGVAEAIRLLNKKGYLVIVVTNQPVIARGELSLEELREIHNKMETLLGQEGAYIDDLYVCPHHPDRGFEGERIEYKVECGCRKPKPGMLLEAAEKYHIDLGSSWMIGDGERDLEAGKRAGCKVALVGGRKMEGVLAYENLIECITDLLYRDTVSHECEDIDTDTDREKG